MIYYPELHIHIQNKIKVSLDLTNLATKNYLKDATGVAMFKLNA